MSRNALVIGINTYSYEHLNNLTAPGRDAEAVAQLLENYGDFKITRLPAVKDKQNNTIRVGKKTKVTLTQLEDAIVQLFKPNGKPPDTALLYFSGHGLRKSKGIQEGFLATSDVNPDMGNWGVRLKWLRELLQESEVRQQIIILDCCYAGEVLNIAEADPGDRGKGRDRCFIAASRAFELAYEDIGSNHSVLTSALIKGLEPSQERWVTNYSLVDLLTQEQNAFPQRPIFSNSGEPINLTHRWTAATTQSAASEKSICPYKGLAYFDCTEEDAKYFYGRTALTDQLLEKVRVGNFIAVLGASGSGKSSVVRAGLLYQLQLGQRLSGSESRQIKILQPGEHPLNSLALTFVDSGLSDIERATQLAQAEDLIKKGSEGLRQLIAVTDTQRLILVVDQFEEAFTLCQDSSERQQFFECLLGALPKTGDKLCLVLTMRADFFGKCLEQDYSGLAQQIQEHGIAVMPMSPEELKQAIVEPAKQVELEIEPELVKEILADVADAPGYLPLLQYTLTRLWEESTDNCLRLNTYVKLGGVMGTLRQRATEVYELFSEEEQAAVKHIFLTLTQLGEGTEDTRRRVLKPNLVNQRYNEELIDTVVQKLADEKLVVTTEMVGKGGGAKRVAVVDVAHEALIRHWSLLRNWISENRDGMRIARKIEAAAEEWKREGKPEEIAFLLSGAKLSNAEDYLAKDLSQGQLNSDAQELIKVSQKVRDNIIDKEKQRQQEEKQRQQKLLEESEAKRKAEVKARQLAHAKQKQLRIWLILVIEVGVFAIILSLQFYKQAINSYLLAKAANLKHSLSVKPTTEELLQAIESTARSQDYQKSLQPTVINEINSNLLTALDKVRERNLLGLTENLSLIAFSRDGNKIISGGDDNKMRLWDTESGQIIHTLQGHTRAVNDIVFSRDDNKIISGGDDNTVLLWDTESGQLIHTLEGHKSAVNAIAFSPDDNKILSGSWDNTLRLWDTKSGQLIHTLQGHTDHITSIAFSPDGKRILSGSGDNTLRLWDTKSGQLIHIYKGHKSAVNAIAFSPDGKKIVSGSDDNTLRLWDIESGQLLYTLEGHKGIVNAIAFSRDGNKILSSSYDNTVRLWNTDSGQLIHTLHGHTAFVTDIAFSPDGKKIVSGSDDHTLRLWETESGQLLHTYQGHTRAVNDIAFSRDGNKIISGGDDNTVRLWDSESVQLLYTLHAPKSVVHGIAGIAFSPEGKKIVSDSDDHNLRLWDIESGQLLYTLQGHASWINVIAFSRYGKKILSGSADKTLRLWDTESGQLLHTLHGHKSFVTDIAFSPDGKKILSGSADNTVLLWDIESGQLLYTLEGHTSFVNDIAFSPDGKKILSGSADKTLRLWDTASAQLLYTLEGHKSAVNDIAFSPDGNKILSGSWDNTVRLWDTASGQLLYTLEGHKSAVNDIAFSPDGNKIISSSSDNTVLLWDTASGQLLHTLEGHKSAVNDIAFSLDGKKILSGSADKTLRLWDTESGQPLHTLHGHTDGVNVIAFSPDGKQILSGSRDNTVRIWRNYSWQEALKEGCNQLQFHPDLVAPKNNKAGEACLKYAGWEDKTKADFLVRQGRAFVLQKEPNFNNAVKKFKKAQKLNPDIDLNPSTKEIDKDPKTVAQQLAQE
ncbi:MAG: peptidase C14 [Moorea sp. SIOASIH]|uniref:nSTAND1 domain-containing NTPase n=1 Tax=Moorena sp. SIOASIH TaxID=2607817 RepID=UPI0013B68A38|nr:PQQ-binding-like beta-propeller repeat protein [Moorena sp. SIOASIH]NEO41626.1 peptidase C14 [Moorena sp. SIOASIH]